MNCLCSFTKNKKNKACFQHDMAYGDFKDLNRRRFADKFKIQNMMDNNADLLQ